LTEEAAKIEGMAKRPEEQIKKRVGVALNQISTINSCDPDKTDILLL